ncbi:MAG: delta-60 repeat domain-containing protein [Flavobacteriales bacterium]|nr:delta-60 repeat domain-containing protein [Flavobacteriales bacterium]
MRFPGEQTDKRLVRFLPNGARDEVFNNSGLGQGRLTAWNGDTFYVATSQTVRRILSNGIQDPSFIEMNSGPYFSSLQGGDYHVYADGRVLMSGVHVLSDTVRDFVGHHCLVWFSSEGYLDTTQHHRKCLGSLNVFQALPDGRFIGSGSTGTWDGQAASNIIRFHADGELDATFQANVWWGQAYGFLPLDDGRVYAAGAFRITGITDTLRLVRFMPDGTLDPTFNNFLDFDVVELSGPNGGVPSYIHPLDTGRLIVTGGFERVDDQVRKGLCLVDTAGNLLDGHFEGSGAGNYVYQGSTLGTVRGILPVGDDHWYIWGGYHGYDDGTLNDPGQRMVSRLHGLHTGVGSVPAPPAQALLSIHPNPADAWVALDYDLLVPPQDAALVVRDMGGREVYRQELRQQKQQVVWDVRPVAPGTYTASLLIGERMLRTEKIIIRP